MDFNAHNDSNYIFGFGNIVPVSSYHESAVADVAVLQSAKPQGTATQHQQIPDLTHLDGARPISSVTSQSHGVPQISMPLEQSHEASGLHENSRQLITGQVTYKSGPSEEEWEHHRPQIQSLYQKGDLKKLTEVMKRDHGFRATVKMYKSHFDKWGVAKNIRTEEMEAIIRKEAERSRSGKTSAFRLRNAQVPHLKIARFRARRGLLSEEQALRLRAKTPPGLTCHTPLASPLRLPRTLETPERIVRSVRDYVYGSFEEGNWIITEDDDCISKSGSVGILGHFGNECTHAFRLLKCGQNRHAWQLLNTAMARIESIVAIEDPYVLSFTIKVVLETFIQGVSQDIVHTSLRHFAAMSSISKPEKHPFNQIFPWLADLDISQLESVLVLLGQCQKECFAHKSGRYNMVVLDLQDTMVRSQEPETSLEGYLTLSHECDQTLGEADMRSLRLRVRVANCYYGNGDLEEAIEAAQSVIEFTAQNSNIPQGMSAAAFDILSEAQCELGDRDSAERSKRLSISILVDLCGWEDSKVLRRMFEFETWLEKWNRPEEAAEVRSHREGIMNSEYENFHTEEEERWEKYQASQNITLE